MTELSRDAVALIDAVGTADGPGDGNRARVRQRLAASFALGGAGVAIAKGAGAGTKLAAAGISAAAGKATLAGAGAKLTLASVALWAAAGSAIGFTVMVPAVMLSSPSELQSTNVQAAPSVRSDLNVPPKAPEQRDAVSATAALTAEIQPVQPAPAAAHAQAAPLPRAPAKTSTAPQTVAKSEATPSSEVTEVTLGMEMQLLKAAQRELSQKRARVALSLLDEHAQKFPNGALSAERSAARVVALCALGRTSEARTMAKAFLSAAPKSPLVPRIRESCAFAGDPMEVRE